MPIFISHYGEAAKVEADLGAFVASPCAAAETGLTIGTNITLGDAAVDALASSGFGRSVRELTFHEVGLSPEALGRILALPRLIALGLHGGAAQDGGADVAFPTLGAAHWQVLLTHPGTARLGQLALPFQSVQDDVRQALRARVAELVIW